MATSINGETKVSGREPSNGAGAVARSVLGATIESIRLTPYSCAAVCAIVLGVALRVTGYLARWPVNIDDARLAINIASRTPAQLMRPLDFEQTAPIGLLWTDWGLTRVIGVNEYVLRAIPLLAGALLLVMLWHLGRTLLGPRQGALAALLGAISPLLVFYGGAYSIKQYGADACITAAVLVYAVPVLRDPTRRAAWLRLAIVGVVAEWASETAIFVLFGVGLAALIAVMRPFPRGRELRYGLAASALWIVSFLVLYLAIYRPVAFNPYMAHFWDLTPDGRGESAARFWYLAVFRAWVRPFMGLQLGRFAAAKLATASAMTGLVLIARRRGLRWAALLAGPYLALTLLIALHWYPPGDRLVLFAAPCIILIFSEVIASGVELVPATMQGAIMLTMFVALAVCGLVSGLAGAQAYLPEEDSRPLVERAAASTAAPVYIMARGVPAWVFYTTKWQHPDGNRLRWIAQVTSAMSGPAFENAPSRGRAVHEEGDSLSDDYQGRRELIGLGSGLQRLSGGTSSSMVDSGWADNEVRRMRAVAEPTVWLFASHYLVPNDPSGGVEISALLAAIHRAGGTTVVSDVRSNAALYEVRFGY